MTIQTHPFPVLLHLEWSLVGLEIASELLPTPGPPPLHPLLPLMTVVGAVGFGLLGLRLPMKPGWPQWSFTALEFGLVAIVALTSLQRLRLFAFLYLVMVIRSCLMFQLAGRITVAALSFVLFLGMLWSKLIWLGERTGGGRLPPGGRDRVQTLLVGFSLNFAFVFALSLIFGLLLVNALLSERASRDRLVQANQQLREYALRVEELAMTQERTRIAREIHDSLGHVLTALNIQLEGALKLGDTQPEQSRQFLTQAKELGSTALREVRASVGALRTTPLSQHPLPTALQRLAHQHEQMTGVMPQVQVPPSARSLPASVQLALYRVAQEALTNVARHAQARSVSVQIQITPADVQLTVTDDGVGFHPEQNTTGFGLQGMMERMQSAGGDLWMTSQPGGGCQVVARLPLPSTVRI